MRRSGRTLWLLGLVAAAGCRATDGPWRLAPSADDGEPGWDAARFAPRWQRDGGGDARAIAPADLDGDGEDEAFYGGRGLFAVDRAARDLHAPAWSLPWPAGADRGSEAVQTVALFATDADVDGVPDALAVSGRGAAWAVDGASGRALWETTAPGAARGAAAFDLDEDGARELLLLGSTFAYGGATGEPSWAADLASPVVLAVPAELDGAPGEDVLVVRAPDPGTRFGEGEPTVHALSGAGATLWSWTPPAEARALAAADLDGDGRHEAVVGMDGTIAAAGARGGWEIEVEGAVDHVAAADLDGDGRDEVVAGLVGARGPRLVALGRDGTPRWRRTLLAPVRGLRAGQLDRDAPEEAVAGLGAAGPHPIGAVLAVDADGAALWQVDTHLPTRAVALAQGAHGAVVLAAGDDAVLRALDAADGRLAWDWVAGRFVAAVAAGDLDGDGADEVVSADDAGNLVLSDPLDGAEAWATRLDVGTQGQATGLAIRDLDGDGEGDVIASAVRAGDRLSGVVERRAADGSPAWSRVDDAEAWDAAVADLDGEGALEIVFAEVDPEAGTCGAAAVDAAGATLWRTELGPCLGARVAVGDVDGDGLDEVAYGDASPAGPARVALLAGDGAVRWRAEEADATTLWIAVVPGGVVHGGPAEGDRGHATWRAADGGAVAWRHLVEPADDPDVPGGRLAATVGAGTPVPDGEGPPAIAVTTELGDLRLLDGRTGEPRWVARLEEEALPADRRHAGGPVAYVPGGEGTPPALVVATWAPVRTRAEVLAFSLDGGEVGGFDTEGEGAAVVPARWGDGRMGAAVGAGLDVWAVEVRRAE